MPRTNTLTQTVESTAHDTISRDYDGLMVECPYCNRHPYLSVRLDSTCPCGADLTLKLEWEREEPEENNDD